MYKVKQNVGESVYTDESLTASQQRVTPDPDNLGFYLIEDNRTAQEKIEDSLAVTREKFKSSRALMVSQIKVTVSTGKVFDGDEISQSRMARAIVASDPLETVPWVLADSTTGTVVTREELREALRLAGDAQTAVWTA